MPTSKSIVVRLTCPSVAFYEFFKTTEHLLSKPNVAGAIVTKIEIFGSQRTVEYLTAQGDPESFVDEATVNDTEQSITYKVLKGDVLKYYKTFSVALQTTNAKDTVNWTATYDKKSPTSQDPIDLVLGLLLAVSVGVNSYLSVTTSIVVKLTCPSGAFYEFFKSTENLLPRPEVAGAIVTDIKIDGAQRTVAYRTPQGSVERLVDEVKVNETEKSITYKVLDGDILQYYKTFSVALQTTYGSSNIVNWTATYDKKSPTSQDPIDLYLGLLLAVSVGVNSYLSN